MPTWIIEPRDPLIVRDGRPFGPDPGARARSLAFPFPSTTTGGVRNRAGLHADGSFDHAQSDRVKREVRVRGPLLVELYDDNGQSRVRWFAAAPADAFLLRTKWRDDVTVLRRVPLRAPSDAIYGAPDGDPLELVGLRRYHKEKPPVRTPQFWYWDTFLAWLTTPQEGGRKLDELGLAGPTAEMRMHVSIDATTQTAFEGLLFQTNGLEFTSLDRRRLALAVSTEATFTHFKGGLVPLGGERRLVAWRQIDASLPKCPDELRTTIIRERACRVVLLTPAYFAAGLRPSWLLTPHAGVATTLRAALVGRPEVVSGWDLAAERTDANGKVVRGAPKPTRRLAPAGSVFFLSLPRDASDQAINSWIDSMWMQNVSDDSSSRDEGFGLAVLGTWSGDLVSMEVD